MDAMQRFDEPESGDQVGRDLIEELLGTAFILQDLMGSLLEEMPEDAFPGEDNAAVLLEMVIGSSDPAIVASGESGCRAATALIRAVRDRIIDDLRLAAELAGAKR
jgi:hypothetical protein